MTRKIIAIVGPTATGKTGIGVNVAKDFNGEIISADSRQVFRGLDIGSGKEGVPAHSAGIPNDKFLTRLPDGQVSNNPQTPNSRLQTLRDALRFVDDVPQWLIDIKDPGEDFHLFGFLELANLAIEDIFSRGKTPVIVGGTGLYIQGLVEGFRLQNTEFRIQNSVAKTRLELESLTKEELQRILVELDSEALSKVDQNNPHRLIRAIERAQDGFEMIKVKPDYDALQIGINWPKEVLADRIDKRVDDRFDQGMLEEVMGLLNQGVDPEWLIKLGLEYREITKFLLSCQSRPTCCHSSPRIKYGVNSNRNLDPRVPLQNCIAGPEDDKLDQIKKSQEFRDMSETLKLRIRQFAKRQTTWFKRFPEIVWESDYIKIKKIVEDYLS